MVVNCPTLPYCYMTLYELSCECFHTYWIHLPFCAVFPISTGATSEVCRNNFRFVHKITEDIHKSQTLIDFIWLYNPWEQMKGKIPNKEMKHFFMEHFKWTIILVSFCWRLDNSSLLLQNLKTSINAKSEIEQKQWLISALPIFFFFFFHIKCNQMFVIITFIEFPSIDNLIPHS